VDPVPDPLLLGKSGSAGSRTHTSRSVAVRKFSTHATQAVLTCITDFRQEAAPLRCVTGPRREEPNPVTHYAC
jgi:hypothetical protein